MPHHRSPYNGVQMEESFRAGLISGTGAEGLGIALRLAAAGHTLALGSRSAERGRQKALEINQQLGEERIQGMDNHELVASCEMLFLTVPFVHAEKVIEEYQQDFWEDQILVDVTVPVVFNKGPRMLELGGKSGAEHLQSLLSAGPTVVGAFKTLSSHSLCEMDSALDCDEFVCSDSQPAKERVLEVVSQIPSLRWIDAGPLRYCRSLEAITLLEIGLNRRYKVKGSRVQMVGL